MLDDLIALPTVSSVKPELQHGQPTSGRSRLGEWLLGAGFRVEVMELPNQPGKANLIATLGTGPGGPGPVRAHRYGPL
jgi:acetylornithine deacetylase